MQLAPSILAADLADLAAALRICEEGGADLIHVDVMDGHFVPNLTFGIPVLAALARRTRLPLDVHLMVQSPESLLERYLEAGATWVTVHWEATTHLERTLSRVRAAGARAGVALNPATPVEVLIDVLPALDHILLMSVNPGFAGQSFIPWTLDKARRLRKLAHSRGCEPTLEMDGGLGLGNLADARDAGVEVAVVGSAVFSAPDPVGRIRELRAAADDSGG